MSLLNTGHKFSTQYPAAVETIFKAWVVAEQEGWMVFVSDLRHPDGPNAQPLHESFVDNEDDGKARVEQAIHRQISRDGLKHETLIWVESHPASYPFLFLAEYPNGEDPLYEVRVTLIGVPGHWTTGIFDCRKTGVDRSLSIVPTGLHVTPEDAKDQIQANLFDLLEAENLPKKNLIWTEVTPNWDFLKF